MRERSTNAFMEQHEHEGGLASLFSQPVGVVLSVALDQAVSFQFTEIITELSQLVLIRGEIKRGEDGLVNLRRAPSADMGTGVEQDLEQAQDTDVVDFEAGNSGFAGRDGRGELLKQ